MLKVRDPKYNSNKCMEQRIKTFENWPLSFISYKDLTNDGFVYTGKKDSVICVYCVVIIEHWEEVDVANREHRKHSPFCPFVCMVGDAETESGTRGMPIFVGNVQTLQIVLYHTQRIC